MNYVFFGTPEFAIIILKTLIEAGLMPALVVTAPDKPQGRGNMLTPPPVKTLAEDYGISFAQPATLKNNDDLVSTITKIHPDLFVVAAYGKIIPKILLDIPRKGAINVHPSLLPRYRGPSPIQAAILNGDEVTGVSIMLLDEEMDHGPILAVQELGISKFYATELQDQLAHLGAQLLIETIPKWLSSDEIAPQPQDHAKATYTKMITKEDGRIDWHRSAEAIERMIRAYTPWPSAWTTLKQGGKNLRVKILNVSLEGATSDSEERRSDPKPGTIIKQNSDLLVACGEGVLLVERLQAEGGKPMSGAVFLNGLRDASVIFGI